MKNTQTTLKLVNPKFITSGQTDRYYKLETTELTLATRALFSLLKGLIYWDDAKRGFVRSVPIKVKTMGLNIKRSRATVQRLLSLLVAAGEIKAVRQFAPNGRELPSYYTFPKMTAWLSELQGHEQLDELKEEVTYAEGHSLAEAVGLKNEAPIKQGLSSTKKNTYIRFSKDSEKEEFLGITGSIKYVPQLYGIIQKVRPGVDADVVFKFFREMISRPEFVLEKGLNYLGVFWGFVRKCVVPYFGTYTSKPKKTAEDTRQTVPAICYEHLKPVETDTPEGKIRMALFQKFPATYQNWFADTKMVCSDGSLFIKAKTQFATGYIARNHDNYLSFLAHSLGLKVRFQT